MPGAVLRLLRELHGVPKSALGCGHCYYTPILQGRTRECREVEETARISRLVSDRATTPARLCTDHSFTGSSNMAMAAHARWASITAWRCSKALTRLSSRNPHSKSRRWVLLLTRFTDGNAKGRMVSIARERAGGGLTVIMSSHFMSGSSSSSLLL